MCSTFSKATVKAKISERWGDYSTQAPAVARPRVSTQKPVASATYIPLRSGFTPSPRPHPFSGTGRPQSAFLTPSPRPQSPFVATGRPQSAFRPLIGAAVQVPYSSPVRPVATRPIIGAAVEVPYSSPVHPVATSRPQSAFGPLIGAAAFDNQNTQVINMTQGGGTGANWIFHGPVTINNYYT